MVIAQWEEDIKYILLSSSEFSHGLAISLSEAKTLIPQLTRMIREHPENTQKQKKRNRRKT